MSRFLRDMQLRLGIFAELFAFLWRRKLWWLIPMMAVIVLFALMIMLGSATPLGPFIYTLI